MHTYVRAPSHADTLIDVFRPGLRMRDAGPSGNLSRGVGAGEPISGPVQHVAPNNRRRDQSTSRRYSYLRGRRCRRISHPLGSLIMSGHAHLHLHTSHARGEGQANVTRWVSFVWSARHFHCRRSSSAAPLPPIYRHFSIKYLSLPPLCPPPRAPPPPPARITPAALLLIETTSDKTNAVRSFRKSNLARRNATTLDQTTVALTVPE
jgi:hypothetical protein